MPKLWRYNLHYFDYLHDPHRSLENKSRLIAHWIEHNPPGTEDAWEPYPTSLRIVNWIKFFLALHSVKASGGNGEKGNGTSLKLEKELPPPQWTKNLYLQTLWLERNIEYHLLANHYLKNGVALFFAGMYFEGVDADRWIKKGLKILREELEEQFLLDGGHYERSPMYHSICVIDYVDVLNLMISSRDARSFGEKNHFVTRVTQALDFLNDICLPDGEIPLFNDSAFGVAPSPGDIFAYALRVIGYVRPGGQSDLSVIQKAASGYYVLRKGNDMMVIDCGEIGPSYQPGHAHCDTLSYELAVDGRRMIVDSGVFDYEPSRQRAYAKSARAHNTVMIDDEEQSEIWGVFRVERRAHPIYGSARETSDNRAVFEGAHDGYTRLVGNPIHHRTIEYDGHGEWLIVDHIEGTGKHRVKSYVHLHPSYTANVEGRRVSIRDGSGVEWAGLEVLDTGEISVKEDSWYYPEFGRATKNTAIVCARSGDIPMRLGYRITTANSSPLVES
jgi:uncharacterized heparinase superfamily protein